MEVANIYRVKELGQRLIESASKGDLKEVTNLLEMGADPSWANATCLMLSVYNGHTDVVRLLLDSGLDTYENCMYANEMNTLSLRTSRCCAFTCISCQRADKKLPWRPNIEIEELLRERLEKYKGPLDKCYDTVHNIYYYTTSPLTAKNRTRG